MGVERGEVPGLQRLDLAGRAGAVERVDPGRARHDEAADVAARVGRFEARPVDRVRSEEHTSELQSRQYLVCRLLLEKKKKYKLFSSSPYITYSPHTFQLSTPISSRCPSPISSHSLNLFTLTSYKLRSPTSMCPLTAP